MDPLPLLTGCLDRLLEQDLDGAVLLVAGATDPISLGLACFVAFMGGRHDEAAELARRALACRTPDQDPDTSAFVRAAAALAASGSGEEETGRPFDELAETIASVDPSTRWGAFVHYLAAEASMANARLGLAAALYPRPPRPTPHEVWDGHPWSALMSVCAARIAAFTGHIDDAARLLPERADGLLEWIVAGTRTLVAGNAADERTVAELAERIEQDGPAPTDYLGRGAYLLVAYGTVALGDKQTGARLALRAGGDEELAALTLIDRALCYEMLTAAALETDDLAAAAAWRERALPMLATRVAAPCVERINARVSLLTGDFATAEAHAERAIELARADERVIEVAEGEIILARVRIAADQVGEASRVLRAAVREGDGRGHHAVRRSAALTLRPARRRLPPSAGAGWGVLSGREREVAELILAGRETDQIAEELHLSRATVLVHTSRILAAFGVATRIGFLAAARDRVGGTDPGPVPLTPRQSEVIALVAAGYGNQQIAATLGIGVKAVEKHVSDARLRWSVPSRFALARAWWRSAGA